MDWLRWICLNLREEVPKQRKKKSLSENKAKLDF